MQTFERLFNKDIQMASNSFDLSPNMLLKSRWSYSLSNCEGPLCCRSTGHFVISGNVKKLLAA